MLRRFISNQIQSILRQKFTGDLIEVINESHLHSRGINSHFKVIIASDEFIGKSLVQRQRLVNQVLDDIWKSGVHSISIHAKTKQEYTGRVPKSPGCANNN